MSRVRALRDLPARELRHGLDGTRDPLSREEAQGLRPQQEIPLRRLLVRGHPDTPVVVAVKKNRVTISPIQNIARLSSISIDPSR